MELWKAAFGFETHYEVSDNGNCRRVAPNGKKNGGNLVGGRLRGYRRWCLSVDCRNYYASAHRLVWQSFNRALVDGEQINHLNGRKADNRLANLEACSPAENLRHSREVLGNIPKGGKFDSVGEANVKAKLKDSDIHDIRRRVAGGETQTAVGADLGVAQSTISLIVLRKGWAHI